MYPSFFRFKRLVEHQDQEYQQEQQRENKNNNNNNNDNNDNNNNSISDTASITNNVEEFKILFRTQEKACYELRSENTVLKLKLDAANEMIRNQSKKIQSVKMKKNKLQIENNVYKNVLCGSSLSLNNNNNNNNYSNNNNNSPNRCIKNEEHNSSNTHSYPPPPPPPLPLPPSTKLKVNGNFQMNSVLDELKSKIKKID
jgi:hypothetical protein